MVQGHAIFISINLQQSTSKCLWSFTDNVFKEYGQDKITYTNIQTHLTR